MKTEYITIEQAAEIAGLSVSGVRRQPYMPKPATNIKNRLLYDKEAFMQALKAEQKAFEDDRPNMITEREMAALVGLSQTRISQLEIMPPVIMKVRQEHYYDKKIAMANWAAYKAGKPELINKGMASVVSENALNNQFVAFMKGDFAPPSIKTRHQEKRMTARRTRPVTTLVRLESEFDFNSKKQYSRLKNG